jgi:eukaryotic-like serine/threonine-protein kinase
MEGALAILMVFGMPVFIIFIRAYYKHQSALLESGKVDVKQLKASEAERKALEARIQNLESIVCSVDYELNQKLNRVIVEKSQVMAAMPAEAAARAPVVALPAGATVGEMPRRVSAPVATIAHDTTQAGYALGHLAPGQVVLGRYTIERELGRGGMGAVYLARDSKLSERVALKTISSVLANEPDELAERFRMEVQAARKVTHPNVIRIHDLGEDGPLLFLSMEYIDGETLFQRVKRLGTPAINDARRILCDVSAGVAAAHSAGVIHRDLKPHNVLVAGPGGRDVKVIDFGLAKTSFATGMTATGLIMGTPEYMSPEQIKGQRSDARADVYALGAVAYYALTGKAPFTGDTPIAVGFAQVHEPPRPPRELRPEIPVKLEEVILRALAKDPVARYSDAGAWKEALEGT